MPTFQEIEYIRELIAKYLSNELSEAEDASLQKWIDESTANKAMFDSLTNSDLWLQQLHEWVLDEENKELVWQKIQTKRKIRHGGSAFTLFRIAIAASMLVAIGLIIFWVQNRKETKPALVQETKPTSNDVAPGGFKARLTLADGRTLILDSAGIGKLAEQGNMTVMNKDGRLAYQPSTGNSTAIIYNTLSTGKGEIYSLSLSDGSRVWLNSASSIRYPVSFAGKERSVEITGEAYFEITHDATKPFRVIAGGMETEVLGTRFNINSYKDEAMIRTTLLEGKVQVTSPGGLRQVVLVPGQQAQLTTANKTMKVTSEVDKEEVLAWKNGKFVFNDVAIEEVMRQLERWYDVEIIYGENMKNRTFHINGQISRYSNASKALEMLEATGWLHFKMEGKKITVWH
jgi:ferric-dicitrate binding protein FerR (iron transport regulator)